MHPKRKQRLTLVAFLFAGVAVAVGLALFALNENINLFYPPDQIARGEAPVDQRIRAGAKARDHDPAVSCVAHGRRPCP